MWARVSRFEEPVDRIDDDIRDSRAAIEEFMGRSSGSEGIYYLVDRETGRTMAITLWVSEEAMRASEEVADEIRQGSARRVGGKVVGVEHYEVVMQPAEMLVRP